MLCLIDFLFILYYFFSKMNNFLLKTFPRLLLLFFKSRVILSFAIYYFFH